MRLTMKPLAGFLTLALAVLVFAKPVTAAPAQCETIRVNGTHDWYPIVMRRVESDGFSGILFDVSLKLFTQLGVRLEVQRKTPWKRLFLQMDEGSLDAILGVYWTRERAEKYLYSDAITRDDVAIFVKKGSESRYQNLSDLIGLQGVRPLGGSYGEEFDQYAKKNLSIKQVPSEEQDRIIKMVAFGRADYAVLGRFDGLADIRTSGNQGNVVELPWRVTNNPVHILIAKNSPCAQLLPDINRVISEMHQDGTIKQLEESYLNPAS